jgi:CHAD domain-containing protein
MPDNDLQNLAGALQKQWKRYKKALRRCQNKFSEEAIHACRVQARRLLSSFDLRAGLVTARHLGKARRALKERLDALDELRDTQVQAAAVSRLLRIFPAARPFHTYLLKREARLRKETRKSLRHLHVHHLAKLVASCRADVTEQLEERPTKEIAAFLVRSAARAFARTRQRRERIVPKDPGSIHRTRVAFKKFRYMVEALGNYFPGLTEEHLASMRHYQTLMGEIQDAELLLRALDKFLRRQEIKTGAAVRFHEELVRRRQWLIRVYLKEADQLLTFWPLHRGGARVRRDPAGRPAQEG